MTNSDFSNLINRKPKWYIKGYDNYFFNSENQLVNLDTNNIIKKSVKDYSTGFRLNGKFITLKKLKPLLTKEKKYLNLTTQEQELANILNF